MAPVLDQSLLLPFELWYEDFAPQYPTIRISNDHASATITLHGAQVIDYIPRDQEPVIFTSREAIFKEGKAIRGGIPVCWPWFGAHPSDDSKPSHGFARNQFWNLISSHRSDAGTEVVLELDTSADSLCPSPCKLRLQIRVGKKLELSLTSTNAGGSPMTIGGALHSYFTVGAIEQTTLTGLEDTHFLNKVDNTEDTQQGAINFDSEIDNIYTDTCSKVKVHDPILKRVITVEKVGSHSTVIWNPWSDNSLPDLADFEFNEFVCIEAANALDDVYHLQPGESHTLATTIHSTPLS